MFYNEPPVPSDCSTVTSGPTGLAIVHSALPACRCVYDTAVPRPTKAHAYGDETGSSYNRVSELCSGSARAGTSHTFLSLSICHLVPFTKSTLCFHHVRAVQYGVQSLSGNKGLCSCQHWDFTYDGEPCLNTTLLLTLFG